MLKKLRLKFICAIMAVVTLMLCILLGLVIFFMNKGLEYQSLRLMQSIAQEMPPGEPFRGWDRDIRLPVFTAVLDHQGRVLRTEGNSFDLSVDRVVAAAQARQDQTGRLEEFDLRYYKARRPMSQIIVFADMSTERSTMSNLVRSCMVIGISSFLMFLGISVLLVGWMIRPVEDAWKQQKQFVADASHELKTPLAVIMTNAELLQEEGYTGQEYSQFSGSILTMSRQMRGLVEGLLELARVDNGAVKTGYVSLDLGELVSDGLLPFEPLYFERGLALVSDVESQVRLRGSAQHLRQVLDILLDNAMKYSVPQGQVRVALRRSSGHCLLSVANPGAELTRQEQRDIFKRFYRVDKARSRDGSYGLGLSIAQRIVEEHRGRIWVESEGGTNTFYVQLPLNS